MASFHEQYEFYSHMENMTFARGIYQELRNLPF